MPPKRTINIESARIGAGGKFEGKFTPKKNPDYIPKRLEVWDKLYNAHKAKISARAEKETKDIEIILPDGTKKQGKSWATTPMDIATGISKGLAASVVVAQVTYTETIASLEELKGNEMSASLSDSEDEEEQGSGSVLWDLCRPLEGSCKLELLKWDHPKGSEAFWHSSAHMLGSALETLYGGHLCVGPPLEPGFYYDIFVGDKKLNENDFKDIETHVAEMAKKNEKFERVVITKEEALELFQDNPFKVQLISTKIPDGSLTSAYRCGPLIDLCRGPHVPSTDRIKSMMCTKNSSAYWLGKSEYDSLQRIYGVSFPDDKRMKEYKKMLEEAAERDHRTVGTRQELYFFHAVYSPGSCFWMPMGARIYNKLVEFIRKEYTIRGFQEVISPNIYNEKLFHTSGHYQNYKDNMYGFDVEGETWFLKPMNCPGHCMIFDHRVRSYKELPFRMASFGVLHRNELSGTLSGLTRVRRFQQDDAHIFCRPDQIKSEVKGALEFLYYVYGVMGFEFSIALSTRPKKAIGEKAVWDKAEAAMKEVLTESGKEWTLNPGDGAFYGPKIDIRLTDAMRRRHQCGTIQLDFQLPIRFNLQYRTQGHEDEQEEGDAAEKKPKEKEAKEAKAAKAETPKAAEEKKEEGEPEKKGEYVWKEGKIKAGFERPVIIHRAILGSVERQVAILAEHFGGKWPFWLSPRQIKVIPVAANFLEYGQYVTDTLTRFGFFAELDASGNTLNKKIRNAQIESWNYSAIVGEQEEEKMSVNLRSRESKAALGDFTLAALCEKLTNENERNSEAFNEFTEFKGRSPAPVEDKPAKEVKPAKGAAVEAKPAKEVKPAKGAAAEAKPAKEDKPAKGAAAEAKPAKEDKPAKGAAASDPNEAHLMEYPYLGGYFPSKKDASVFASTVSLPKTPNLARWYEHISSFTAAERESWK